MRYLLAMTVFVLSMLCAGLAAQQAPPVKMSWQMDSASFQFRDATLIAYPVAASDFVVPLRVAYLSDLDVYVWQFKAPIPAAYQQGDWILAGYAHGWVVAQRFQVKDGATAKLTPVSWTPPVVRPIRPGQPVTVDYEVPKVDPSVVKRWEVQQDGQTIPMDASGQGVGGTLDRARSTGLRLVLVGEPKEHTLAGPELEIAPEEGDRT